MAAMTQSGFEAWLRRYGASWEARDPKAAADLFSPDAEYYWTPIDPPQRGRDEIAAAWERAVSQQRDVRFDFEILTVTDVRGIAHWWTELTSEKSGEKVRLDGILVAEFDEGAHCRVFREWWHSVGKAY